MAKRPDTSGLSPLPHAALHVLVALAGGPLHGYAIMGAVEDLTEGRLRMGPGTLYGSIKKLLADGLIEESDTRPDPDLDDERRRYYRLTGLGQAACKAELDRLSTLLSRSRKWIPGLQGT